ncbi:MAG: nucleoside triphosphate hydrolase [Gammaproteobacteria bacterium]|nr:nucleoside triphosphate hydrolase [Gammaproteobacteria bacterium]
MNILEKLTQLEIEASNYGFKWENPHQIMDQIKSECVEIDEHLNSPDSDKLKLQEEIGDLLHAVFSLCIFCKFDAEETLKKSVDKFERRLNTVKKIAEEQGIATLNGYAFDELMQFWDKAKKTVG